MPRSARLTFLGRPHLVLAKANSGAKLFYTDEDYFHYLNILQDLSRHQAIKLFGFCLHAHEVRLLMTPVQFSLSRVMQRIHGSHTLRINHKLRRRGSLFRGRFESQTLSEEQLLQAIRNIHLWPVRRGLVRRAENYPWSSHSAYLGSENVLGKVLMTETILKDFAESPASARRAFSRYVESAALESEEELEPRYLVPSKKVLKKSKRLSLIALAKRVSLLLNVNMLLLSSQSRRQDLVMARRLFATAAVMHSYRTITEVADFLERDKAQISRLVSQGMDLAYKNEPFKLLFNSI